MGTPRTWTARCRRPAGAFPDWSRRPWAERSAILRRAADLIEERGFFLSALVSLEAGKSRLEAMGDVTETADLIRYYCEQMERTAGSTGRWPA